MIKYTNTDKIDCGPKKTTTFDWIIGINMAERWLYKSIKVVEKLA